MLTIPVIAAGGIGVISVLANAFPAECTELVGNALKNNFKSAREIQFRYIEMIELLFSEGNPAGIKALLSAMNLCQNNLRLPLVAVTRSTMISIQKALEKMTGI
jgi:4-hydroxy-tetrahydrodipicolinate synthase